MALYFQTYHCLIIYLLEIWFLHTSWIIYFYFLIFSGLNVTHWILTNLSIYNFCFSLWNKVSSVQFHRRERQLWNCHQQSLSKWNRRICHKRNLQRCPKHEMWSDNQWFKQEVSRNWGTTFFLFLVGPSSWVL